MSRSSTAGRTTVFEARAAVSVKEGDAAPVFGAVWITGRFEVDRDARMVSFYDIKIPTVAFPEGSEEHQKQLAAFLEREIPKWDLEVELDRVIPLLDNAEVALNESAELKQHPAEDHHQVHTGGADPHRWRAEVGRDRELDPRAGDQHPVS